MSYHYSIVIGNVTSMTREVDLDIGVVRPAGREKGNLLAGRLDELRALGHSVQLFEHAPEADWPFNSGTLAARLDSLCQALHSPKLDVIWCVRGGYGCSDLLPLLDWNSLSKTPPKILVGFSDFCALYSSFWSILGWKSLHAPMPGTDLWGGCQSEDVSQTLGFLSGSMRSISIPLITSNSVTIEGVLFGGCLSVLSNLIGTSFLPAQFDGNILFFEDTDENPGRIMRNLQQWQQVGLLKGVKALILGHFRTSGLDEMVVRDRLAARIQEYFSIPVFQTEGFGHKAPNFPLGVGYPAIISHNHIAWGKLDAANRLQQS